MIIQSADLFRARQLLSPYLPPTPLEAAPGLGENIWLKLENLNRTHSFKTRGALNALLSLDDQARAKGIVTASSGNHAQGVAYAAHLLGLRARVLMPSHTPRRKVAGVQRYGAEAVLYGATYDEAEAEARRLEKVEGLTFVSPYNDVKVIAGGGTVGLEILDALPEVERVLVPVGGGGLISGIGVALKAAHPRLEVVGVSSVATPAAYNAVHGQALPQIWETLAEALSGEIETDSITIPLMQQVVDRVVPVSEAAIAEAMRWLLFQQGYVVEGGGAVGVAALLSNAVAFDERPTVVVISGGNVDEATLRRVING
ncbi:MAG TPA: threonine/serine dehydratase [Phototrophicaceae bacterium]|nr:threonine/serine dehydratase [Phototrophicaceae bacterium]